MKIAASVVRQCAKSTRRIAALGVLAFVVVGQFGCGNRAPAPLTDSPVPAFAFAHVSIIDATGAPVKRDQTIVITGERITHVGPASSVEVPAGTRVVDARGKYLIPGLWDLHVHVYFEAPDVLPVFVAYGVTGIRELSLAMPQIQRLRRAGDAGTLLAPRIMAAGQMVEAAAVKDLLMQVSPIIADAASQDRVFVRTPEEARQTIRSLKELQPDLLKLHVNVDRGVYFAALDEAQRLGLSVAGHYPIGEGKQAIALREVVEAGQRSIEHRNDLAAAAAEFAALDATQRQALLARMKERGTTFVPTLVDTGAADYRLGTVEARLQRARSDPRARYISPYLWEVWREFLSLQDSPEPAFEQELAFLRQLHEGGIPILAGTDFTVPFNFPGASLHEELIELVEQVGMTPHEVLQSATRQAAELLGLQDSLGTVEAGKIADLILLDADPLIDIANTQKINAVVRAGRLLERRALDELLRKSAANLQRNLPPPVSGSPSARTFAQ